MPTETMPLRELTVRYAVKMDDEGRPVMIGRTLMTPRESAAVLVPLLQHEPSEVFVLLLLSARQSVIAYHEVGRGTLDTVLVTPRLCSAQHKAEHFLPTVAAGWSVACHSVIVRRAASQKMLCLMRRSA